MHQKPGMAPDALTLLRKLWPLWVAGLIMWSILGFVAWLILR